MISLFESLSPTPKSVFSKAFSDFKSSAFRLEMLPLYSVAQEGEVFKAFLRGDPGPPSEINQDWRNLVQAATAAGKRFERVRVIDGQASNYIRFEVDWGYPKSIEAGEDLRFIIRQEIEPFQTDVPILKDFWLFDRTQCFLMEYDYTGRFLGITQLPENLAELYDSLRKELWAKSVTLNEAQQQIANARV